MEERATHSIEPTKQANGHVKSVLEGFTLQKLTKIHKKALKEEDYEIVELIKEILIERVVKELVNN